MKRSKQTASPSEADGTSGRRNRRQALGLAGVAAAAAAVAAVGMDGGKKAQAASGWSLIIGQGNESNPGDWTGLVGSKTDGPVLHLRNDAEPLQEKWEAVGLDAMSREGTAVVGTTFGSEGFGTRGLSYIGSPDIPPEQWLPGPGIGVDGISGSGPGVRGTSESGPGVTGHSVEQAGVLAESDSGPGVGGVSQSGVGVVGEGANGVRGFGTTGAGVRGDGLTAPGVVGVAPDITPGVHAASAPTGYPGVGPDGGLALEVVGKAAFSTAGKGVVSARSRVAAVLNPAVTAHSHVTVTFTDDPGRTAVKWVERGAGKGFRVHLSRSTERRLCFTYLIVEPGGPVGP